MPGIIEVKLLNDCIMLSVLIQGRDSTFGENRNPIGDQIFQGNEGTGLDAAYVNGLVFCLYD